MGAAAQLKERHLFDNSSIVMDNCTSKDSVNSGPLWYQVRWIYLGQALIGFGISAHPLAITYLDDSPARGYLPIFIAIIYGFRSTGLSIAGLISQQCLSVPASWPYVTSDTVTNPNDPQYLGGWWIGFIPIAVMAFLPALLLFFFPRVMRFSGDLDSTPEENCIESPPRTLRGGNGLIRKGKNQSRGSGDSHVMTTQQPKSKLRIPVSILHFHFLGFFGALHRVMRNWMVLSLIIGDHALSFAYFPDGTYVAKYLQYEFHLSAAQASALGAWTKLPMIFVGYFLSASIIMTGRLKARGTIIMAAVCIACAALLTPIKLLSGCKNDMIAGLTVSYDYTKKNTWSASDRNLTATCNVDFHCPSAYNPVCSPSGVSYVTACHAGCTDKMAKMDGSKNFTVYLHCSCYDELFLNATSGENTLNDGICRTDCTWVYHFILIMLTPLLRNILYGPSLMSKVR
ncbi:Solute carrier organic anion transporter family member 1A5 [Holothuria leucospilota]|uniref:Solute carrier organic anion transporter family member 1A5 n=1 Tax=Holothuria leucospilota TaxID=206669 RepID=A0A9Q1C1V1_HOLLE|nr:Solute carrier organic anion transporter family member 1A5 [Holothuria leucospilota]